MLSGVLTSICFQQVWTDWWRPYQQVNMWFRRNVLVSRGSSDFLTLLFRACRKHCSSRASISSVKSGYKTFSVSCYFSNINNKIFIYRWSFEHIKNGTFLTIRRQNVFIYTCYHEEFSARPGSPRLFHCYFPPCLPPSQWGSAPQNHNRLDL